MMQVSSQSLVDRANRQGTFLKVVSASYFETVGTRLEKGRFLTENDRRNAPRVVVINERMARRYFANENPIGRRVRIASILPGKTQYGPEVEWQIVGVIADEKTTVLTDERTEVVYATYEQSPVYFTFLLCARGSGSSDSRTCHTAGRLSGQQGTGDCGCPDVGSD